MEIFISLIVPVYNVSSYLTRCLESLTFLLDGTNELIVINDGSTDDSPMIAERYCSMHCNAHVYHQKNSGLSAARNSGIKYARGKYIWFIDSDDFIDEKDFCVVHEKILLDTYDIIVFGRIDEYDSYSQRNCQLYNKEFKTGVDFFNSLSIKGIYRTNAWDKIFKRNFLINNQLFFIEGRLYEDMLFCFLSFFKANKVFLCNAYPYHYNLFNNGSITKQVRKKDLDVLWYIKRANELFYNEASIIGITRNAFEQMIFSWVNSCLLKKYIPIQNANNDARDICNQTISNIFFYKSVRYCAFHKAPLRQRLMSILLLLSPKLYFYAVNKLYR